TGLTGTSAARPPAAVPFAAPTPEGPVEGPVPEEPLSEDRDLSRQGPERAVPEDLPAAPRDAASGPDGPGRAPDGPRSPATPADPAASSSSSSSSGGAGTAGGTPHAAEEAAPGDPGPPPSRRPVRGHPYASTGARPDAGAPARDRTGPEHADAPEASRGSRWAERIFPARPRPSPATPGEPSPAAPGEGGPGLPAGGRPGSGESVADEWEDVVESDPPTEEIPPVQESLPPPVARLETPERPDGPRRPREPEEKREEEPEGDRPESSHGKPEGGAEGRQGPSSGGADRPGPPSGAANRPGLPPGVARGMREAEERLARRQARTRPAWLRRRRPARSREDVVPGTQDARAILLGHRRETIGMVLLALAGLLIPFPLAPIAIFRIPVLVWAVAVLVVIACENWHTSDKALGLAAPIVSYSLGGGLVALVRARNDLGAVVDEFFTISGLMFMLGTAWAVFWLAYRLVNPPIPVGRGVRRPG
ncbi:hypothetical protein AB0C32_22550, partial [Streptosporangium sp. NPDC048865]